MLALALLSSSRRGRAQVEVVVTGTRTPESSQRSTVKTDVVTRQEADRRGATNVAEALATQPGVRVDAGAYGYLGGVGAIRIQGFDLQRVLILEDGEPVVGDIGGAVDLSSIPVSDIERIEIVTGPTSALYGSSAIGGVVNIITAPPRNRGAGGRARVEGRSHRGVVLQGSGAANFEEAWIGVETNFVRQDGIARSPDLPDLHVPETSRAMLGVKGGARLTKQVDIRVRARWFRDRLEGLSSRLAPGIGRYILEEPNETHRATLHLIERVDLGRGFGLRLTMGGQWTDNTTGSHQRGSPVGEAHDRHHRMQSFEAITTRADGARTWVTGARAEVERFTQTITKTESVRTGVASQAAEEVAPRLLGRAAVYGQLQWRLSEPFTALLGMRGEMHESYGGAFTPRMALSYRPTASIQLRASTGRGFRVPTAKELGFVFDHSALGYRVLGNSDLSPETSWGVNGDASWLLADGATLRTGAFMNWVDNLIDVDLAGGSTSGTVVDYRYKNFGKARTFGVQLSGTVRLGERFRSELAYDYLWTRDDLNDRPLGGRPPHTLTASLHAMVFGKLELYARWRASTDAFVSTDLRAPGYQTIDVRIARALWPRSQAYLGVLNLTDVHQDPGRVGDLRPPMGRVFHAGIRAELPGDDE